MAVGDTHHQWLWQI